tara:strand:+ start:54 stop:1592 length:1539 start_codon:yes stop_codon:yes gene_type:complete
MKPINNIIVVGAGTAGVSVSSILKKVFPEKKITMIKGRTIPTIGVGESTRENINNFLQFLDIQDKDFMKACDATYKLSIRFENFYEKGDGGFHYPFGWVFLDDQITTTNDWYCKKFLKPDTPITDYANCMVPHMSMINQNKMTDKNIFPSFNHKIHAAYHFDAVKFADWIEQNRFLPMGGETLVEDIEQINRNEDGSIKSLLMDTKKELQADLYIDCTGFKSLLLGQTLQEPFESYEDILPNNSAWATRLPYDNKKEQLKNYTNCTAIENGWVWNVPLWSRIGTGYVFSNKYIDDDSALEQFKNYLGRDDCDFRKIKTKIGIYKRLWVKNVCAIGLSGGFIEPLESNGLLSIHDFTLKLIPILKKNIVSQFAKDHFNLACRREFRAFAEFVALHYNLTNRTDTKYWRDIQNRRYPIEEKFIDSKSNFQIAFENKMESNKYALGGFPFIATGMNWFPITFEELMYKDANSDLKFWEETWRHKLEGFETRKKMFKDLAENCLTMYDYLERNIYG